MKLEMKHEILPSGCFMPGVIDLRKSSGVMNTSVSPWGWTICKVAKYRNTLSLNKHKYYFMKIQYLIKRVYILSLFSCKKKLYTRSGELAYAVFIFDNFSFSETSFFLQNFCISWFFHMFCYFILNFWFTNSFSFNNRGWLEFLQKSSED